MVSGVLGTCWEVDARTLPQGAASGVPRPARGLLSHAPAHGAGHVRGWTRLAAALRVGAIGAALILVLHLRPNGLLPETSRRYGGPP
jgi:hypothetical protein